MTKNLIFIMNFRLRNPLKSGSRDQGDVLCIKSGGVCLRNPDFKGERGDLVSGKRRASVDF